MRTIGKVRAYSPAYIIHVPRLHGTHIATILNPIAKERMFTNELNSIVAIESTVVVVNILVSVSVIQIVKSFQKNSYNLYSRLAPNSTVHVQY